MSFYKIFKYNVCEIFVNVHINVYLFYGILDRLFYVL